MCSLLQVSKSGYYKYLQTVSQNSTNDSLCLSRVKQYRKIQPYVGTYKCWKMLHNDGFKIGRNHLNCLLKEHNMLIRKKKRYCKTSISDGSKVYPNLLKDTEVKRKNQVWVTDITYISKGKGFYYLFLLSDMYTRQILDYEVSSNMLTDNHIRMLKRQLNHVDNTNGLIHHSDHGSQYTSNETISLLKKHGIKISMTGDGKCYDNPIAERINCTMKHEFGLNRTFSTIESLKKATKDAVMIYNSQRLHKSLGYFTPNDFANH
jgi:transposase InsO family protein